MFRFIYTICSFFALLYGAYYVSSHHPEVKAKLFEVFKSGQVHTLEARFSPHQIMEIQKKVLLKDERHRFLEPQIKYSPYLFMEVKYTRRDGTTQEGFLLWDMVDGEKVVNTKTWEKSHGYSDCIKARISTQEFRILHLLAEKGGVLERAILLKQFQSGNEDVDRLIESCRRKKMIVFNGSQYRLHLRNAKLSVIPETVLDDQIVTKSLRHAEKIAPRFSEWQIKHIAESAFGQDFSIRSTLTIYLPIYSISVQNPDQTTRTSYWNGLNGLEIPFSSLIE